MSDFTEHLGPSVQDDIESLRSMLTGNVDAAAALGRIESTVKVLVGTVLEAARADERRVERAERERAEVVGYIEKHRPADVVAALASLAHVRDGCVGGGAVTLPHFSVATMREVLVVLDHVLAWGDWASGELQDAANVVFDAGGPSEDESGFLLSVADSLRVVLDRLEDQLGPDDSAPAPSEA